MARLTRSFSPMPLLISFRVRSVGRLKKRTSSVALPESKSAKKRRYWAMAAGAVRLVARKFVSGRKETSALD